MTHPASCTDPDCQLPYAEHLRGIQISGTATPSRRPEAARAGEADRRLAEDRDAYKRLRHDGTQPLHVGGSARTEARANTRAEVES